MSAETIYAFASGAGRAAIAVIRLSGPNAGVTLKEFAGVLPGPRVATRARFKDPASGLVLDDGLALWFPGPRSATGEDYAEFHIHGGRAVVDAFLTALLGRPGLREAEPGEFVRRGFANGKLDLSQAEALADLVDAQTEFQRRQAIRIAGGELRRRVEAWRRAIIDAQALVEAELDFSDEGDVGFTSTAVAARLRPTLEEIDEALAIAPASERLRDGFIVLILGPPNAGKSTLMNALARRDVAIVSDMPGTTRDMIEVHLDLRGMPVTFIDTAGLREASDEIEKIGIDRVIGRIPHADLLLWLSAGGELEPPIEFLRGTRGVELLCVATKADQTSPADGVLGVSAKTGAGVDALFDVVGERAKQRLGDGASALLIRERHRDSLRSASEAIETSLTGGRPLEFVAEDLRFAGRSLGRIVGAIDVEDVLDAIFSRFCIGK